ncbi:hypothetical protein B0H21DRAFT_816617 [Amylocystis lapponica]|nr:hypothetical protein B0H21DRAFT_816617 [Amylocystis lapponica]
MLPTMLIDLLHDPNHALYSVIAQSLPNGPSSTAPSADEVRTAIPDANAYYCREHNGWVLLTWRSSSVIPPLVRALDASLPDMYRRKLTNSCVGDGEQPFGQANATHHWHRYERAVDASKTNPPYLHGEELLDLHMCCQCSRLCLSSQVIPGVIPAQVVEDFTRDKLAHPLPGKTPKASMLLGWDTVLTIIEKRLWHDETRILPVTRPRFQSKLGWNSTVKAVFDAIEFKAEPLAITSNTSKESTSTSTPVVMNVIVTGEREMIQTALGAHVSQIPRGLLPPVVARHQALEDSWQALGITPSSYSWELLAFAYLAQVRCDPANTMVYFTHLFKIVQTMVDLGETPPSELQTLLMDEQTRHRYTPEMLRQAAGLLGFGKNGDVGMELDSDIDDSFILEAWRSARRRAWRDPTHAVETRHNLNEALKLIADDRASPVLQKAWEEEKGTGMSPDSAYSTLEVPKEVDETMLVAVFLMRVEDQPSQTERMREALNVIAEVTDSARLRQFLETGSDPGDQSHTATQDMPRGLNQLGNTCYLNSLLQYFYTIKDLRDAITPLANADAKLLDDSKVTDDDLKRHRVGGRMVTRREIQRSKKFVNQLADLYWNLEYCDVPAVTPTIDLAKLALVTSQDEEEDDQDRTGTDESNDTDATLVDDAPTHPPYDRSSGSPVQSPTESVLGKRPRDTMMDVDKPHPQENSTVESTRPSTSDAQENVASSSKLKPPDASGDIEMREEEHDTHSGSKAPPLPMRKRQMDDSVMMFGRQHDVSECMDNCMFQIETALLDFQEMTGAEDDKTSVVKRLFYGKKRQRLTDISPSDNPRHQSSIHEKEDLFSHLHVNVSDEGIDLYDGLNRYFDDVVELAGQKKRMEVSLVDLPPLLQIQLQRVQFDRETQQAYKSQAYVKFGETIYMDRFLDSADTTKKAEAKTTQAALTGCRERIQRLTQDKYAPFDVALGSTAEFLSQQTQVDLPEADEALCATLLGERDLVTAQLEKERNDAVRLKGELEDVWKDDTKVAYELTSVFIHRGSSPSWGHYFLYSRYLPDKPDMWFKYNDSDVSVVSKDEVLADTSGSTANPYMLVFARKGCEAIQTVHRFDPESLQDG